jgi:hypothetical protein
MRVVAVVCAYWPNRRANVLRIVADLQAGTRVPDRILILNNHPEPFAVSGADVIHAPANLTCRGKFITALYDRADYYLLLDDDTSVGRQTLEVLCGVARRGICTGYLGCWIDATGSVNAGARLWPRDATEETPCQTFCGCAMFVAWDALVRMLMLEERVRIEGRWPTEGDDILLGLANRSTVVPLHGDADFVDLGYQGQAMCYAHEDYYGMRDAFTRVVLTALADRPLPEWEG